MPTFQVNTAQMGKAGKPGNLVPEIFFIWKMEKQRFSNTTMTEQLYVLGLNECKILCFCVSKSLFLGFNGTLFQGFKTSVWKLCFLGVDKIFQKIYVFRIRGKV